MAMDGNMTFFRHSYQLVWRKSAAIMVIHWGCQDPKMEVLYHIRPYFGGIFPYIGLKNRPYI